MRMTITANDEKSLLASLELAISALKNGLISNQCVVSCKSHHITITKKESGNYSIKGEQGGFDGWQNV